MKKSVLVASYIIFIVLAFINKDYILTWIQQKETTNIVSMLAAATLLAIFPAVPYGVIAVIIGAKFGILAGGFINVTASTIAAFIMFVIVRYAFFEAARGMISRYRKIDRFTQAFEASPFLAVLFARLIPIIPAPAVNVYSGISRIPMAAFLMATVLGKIPVMLVFAFVGDQLFSSVNNVIVAAAVYIVFLIVVFVIYSNVIR